MKIGLMSGAIKNAGDYLIVDRSIMLLKYIYPDAEIVQFERNFNLDGVLEDINSCNILVFAGGPSYHQNLYPKNIPLVKQLELIKPKMLFMGMGWYGRSTQKKDIYNFKFSKSSYLLLNRVSKDTKMLGCRDWYAVKILQNSGIKTPIMTGCPAWYDISCVASDTLRRPIQLPQKIVVSDPANIYFYGNQCIELMHYLKNRFPKSSIIFAFHRGSSHDELTDRLTAKHMEILIQQLKELSITYRDISYGAEGLSIYDDCDLHIGYRVHAHIYNLSKRNLSVLLQEDARGAGVDEALGLNSIPAYSKRLMTNSNCAIRGLNRLLKLEQTNNLIFTELENYLNTIFSINGEVIFRNAFKSMQIYFDQMIKHIKSIEQFII